MPLYMDLHEVEGTTAEDVAAAHMKDEEIQEKYGVKYLTYWFNEAAGKLCNLTRPQRLHREHLLANQFTSRRHIDAVIFHLLVIPAIANPQYEPAIREMIQRGELFREGDGIVLRHQADSRAESDFPRHRHRGGESDVGIQAAQVLVTQLHVASRRRRE